MKIIESIQDKFPVTGEVQRIEILRMDCEASYLTAVIVSIPANHEFPFHVHPQSEDCFFALQGTGNMMEPGHSAPISAPACVWVPEGQPHGLVAGPDGILELGIQAPGAISIPFDKSGNASPAPALTQNLSSIGESATGWVTFLPEKNSGRYLDPCYARLSESERLVAETGEGEMLVIVAEGVVEIAGHSARKLRALGALRIPANMVVELYAVEGPALLLGVRANGPPDKPLKNDMANSGN